MAAIARRSMAFPIPASTELAAADDLNGVSDGSKDFDVSGAARVLIAQIANGTAGTAGIDVVQVSHDGIEWEADDTLLALASDDDSGTVVADGALNAAGTEPSGAAIFKSGPHRGPTLMRVVRDGTTGTSEAWVTGAPQVIGIRVG